MILALLSIIEAGWRSCSPRRPRRNRRVLEPVFSNGTTPPKPPATVSNSASPPSPFSSLSAASSSPTFSTTRKPGTAASYAAKFPALYRTVENKFYIDEIYQAVIVTPLLMFSRLRPWHLVRWSVINGSGYGAGAATRGLGALVAAFSRKHSLLRWLART